MKEKKEPVTIRITPSMRDQLQALAEQERRTLSQFIALILEGYLAKNSEKRAKS
jgi:uncharacterized protein (DUF1778 family)